MRSGVFDKENGGLYRYLNSDGSPMPVEVPKDMYDDAVEAFRAKISQGKVPGVTDVNEAGNYVRKSDLTYADAMNLCKPFTAQSLLYDCATGIIYCSFAFGISALALWLLLFLSIAETAEIRKRLCFPLSEQELRSLGFHMLLIFFVRSLLELNFLNLFGILPDT